MENKSNVLIKQTPPELQLHQILVSTESVSVLAVDPRAIFRPVWMLRQTVVQVIVISLECRVYVRCGADASGLSQAPGHYGYRITACRLPE